MRADAEGVVALVDVDSAAAGAVDVEVTGLLGRVRAVIVKVATEKTVEVGYVLLQMAKTEDKRAAQDVEDAEEIAVVTAVAEVPLMAVKERRQNKMAPTLVAMAKDDDRLRIVGQTTMAVNTPVVRHVVKTTMVPNVAKTTVVLSAAKTTVVLNAVKTTVVLNAARTTLASTPAARDDALLTMEVRPADSV
jgi:predicted aconitase with swiveling domain